uniref:Uncharacterized protein n=1 Tax=Rhizophora mucronata TaxID=61149 RepID=A0A2P2IVN4_RHIMU
MRDVIKKIKIYINIRIT